jgi:mRNA interferase HigB
VHILSRVILVNPEVLDAFKVRHADACKALDLWRKTVAHAHWQHLLDVRKTFPSADGVKVTQGTEEVTFTVFNIKGNTYRLVSEINYQTKVVMVRIVLTHAEYDKGKWKQI